MPQPSKSRTLRVASVAPRERAMPAIMAFATLVGRPTLRRWVRISA